MSAYYPDDYVDTWYHEDELKEEIVKDSTEATENLVKYLVYGKIVDPDVLLQSLYLLAKEHKSDCDFSCTQDDIQMVHVKRLDKLKETYEDQRRYEAKKINHHVKNIVNELTGTGTINRFNLESSLGNLLWMTGAPANFAAENETLKKINIVRA